MNFSLSYPSSISSINLIENYWIFNHSNKIHLCALAHLIYLRPAAMVLGLIDYLRNTDLEEKNLPTVQPQFTRTLAEMYVTIRKI